MTTACQSFGGFESRKLEEDFGEKDGVDLVFAIEVALIFEEDDRAFGRWSSTDRRSSKGLEDPITAEAGLFDLIS